MTTRATNDNCYKYYCLFSQFANHANIRLAYLFFPQTFTFDLAEYNKLSLPRANMEFIVNAFSNDEEQPATNEL